MEVCINFGENVRKYRLAQNISQEKLAELAELHRTYISAVERGKRSISLKNLEKIALALGVSCSVLLEKECIPSDCDIIAPILKHYKEAFSRKKYVPQNDEIDVLMEIYGITPMMKRKNSQYWGRELGMMWQRIIVELSREHCKDFQPALKVNDDEPCDLILGKDAIDTKYRIGSGDSGTLKKFKEYGRFLQKKGYRPVLLILRQDNLKSAITACAHGNWHVLIGEASFIYLSMHLGIDFKALLESQRGKYLL